jgi:DNA invertase Pin-like site-specific DNA recombinase
MFVRAYLRASTLLQDANRARDQIAKFAKEHALKVAAWYVENESGAKLARPELFRMLNDAEDGDLIMVEAVDRLSRLTSADWENLKVLLARKHIRVVALDLPTSWMMARQNVDEFTERMFSAVNAMMLDMLAAVARKDYEDRRRRQAQGVAKAKAARKYTGRRENAERNEGIARMLRGGASWSQVQAAVKCSRATVAKIAKRIPAPLARRVGTSDGRGRH